MMTIGISVSFVLAFLLFPSAMALLPSQKNDKPVHHGLDITPGVARFTERWGWQIVAASVAITVFAVLGLRQLKVEIVSSIISARTPTFTRAWS